MSATITDTGDITIGNYVSGADKQRAAEFYEMGQAKALYAATTGAIKFHANKLLHKAKTHNIGECLPFMSSIQGLKYYVGRDDQGVLRGGNLHWEYVQDVCDQRDDDATKFKKLRYALAQLPSNVAFEFKAAPDLQDGDLVRAAFLKAGFSNIYNKTYLYFGNVADGNPIKKIKSDARTKVKSARRDMELTSMSLAEFFTFYKQNLVSDKKEDHFLLDIDIDVIDKNNSV